MDLENKFAYLKSKAGFSNDELTQLLGVSLRTIYRWDKGETIPKRAVIEYLEQVINSNTRKESHEQFTFIDLFAGIGGLRKGFERIGGKCIFTSEWDKYAQLTYKANFPGEHEIAGDIKKINVKDIPEHNLLLAGFPCQPFSISGKQGGFEDTRGTLFFDVAKIIKLKRPKIVLLENVANFANLGNPGCSRSGRPDPKRAEGREQRAGVTTD